MTTVDGELIVSGAELKVRLGALGLPPSWFAARMKKTMRTVVRWFDEDEVSNDVADELEKLSQQTLDEMIKIVEFWENKPGFVELKTYRTDKEFKSKGKWPAEWHRALTFRLLEHFEAQGRIVTVEYI